MVVSLEYSVSELLKLSVMIKLALS